MRPGAQKFSKLAAFAGTAVLLGAATLAAQYTMTVNRDRLINAQNEPQNWLMMNGDYGSTRYSKLSQVNRDNVKNLRLVWALALGGMQDVGQNGPENEVNPLIDNGFMYTTDGWGTIYKIDARDANQGKFVWVTDPGVKHQGNLSRTRGIALWEDLVIANLPDGRVIAVNRANGEIEVPGQAKSVCDGNRWGHEGDFDAASEIEIVSQNSTALFRLNLSLSPRVRGNSRAGNFAESYSTIFSTRLLLLSLI